jgi:serine phosphatase RsbU (regulator of sigma subunit)
MLRAALTFHEPGAALSRVAGDLQGDLDHVGRFATCFAARLDLASGRLDFADAGHGLAVVLRASGEVTQLNTPDLPLGTMPEAVWRSDHTVLEPGDTLLVVSDGVLDLFESPQDGVRRALQLHRVGARAADYVEELLGGPLGEPDDDLTVVAVRRVR